MRLIFLVALLLNICLSAAHAEQRIALVVGNTVFARAPRITNAAVNADNMTSALRGLGFDVTEMIDAGDTDLRGAVEDFRARLSAGDAVGLFYYSGYAAQFQGANFLLPSDFDSATGHITAADVGAAGIPLDDMLGGHQGGGLQIVLLDPAAPPSGLISDVAPGLATPEPAQNTIVMISAGPIDAATHQPDADPVFTDALVRRLAQPGTSIATILAEVLTDVVLNTQFRQVPEIVLPASGVADFMPAAPAVAPEPATDETSAGGADPPPGSQQSGSGGEVGGGPPTSGPPLDAASGGGGSPDFGQPDQNQIPLDTAGSWDGGSGGSYLGEGQTMPDMSAPGTDDTYLNNPASAVEDQERLRAQQEAQRRYEEELARQQELASAGAQQTDTEQAAPPLDGAVEPQPQPPPPPTAAPEEPAAVEMVRHPTLDAPDQVVAGQEFTVSVALTEEQITPDVTVRAGPESSVTPEGALAFSLSAAGEQWPIDIDLLAAGFDLADAGPWSRRVILYKVGDSDFARFTLKSRMVREGSKPRQLIARLYHEGRFLGSVSRPVTVFRDQTAMDEAAASGGAAASDAAGLVMVAGVEADTATQALATDVNIADQVDDVPDLDVTIHYSDPDTLGDGLIIIHSPHIGAPISAEFTTPEGMSTWLDSQYLRLVTLGLQVRGAKPLQGQAPAASKEFVARVAEGFGSDLYRNYVPGAFKDVFWSLKGQDLLHSIQITSNSPILPWELVRPLAPDGTPDDFLGIKYRLARWAPRSVGQQIDRPLDRLAFTGVATVAPAYNNNLELPFQKVEVDALSKLAGFRLVSGDFVSFEKMIGEVSTGFIHFSGHGEVNDLGTGSPVFAIQLLDQALDPITWGALTFAPHDKGNPFFFFNACDTGRARSLGGFVQGWGPAVLASGASGFIGGMWPLTDQTAADFSTDFYGGIADHLKDGPVYLAEVLQNVRQRFYETGDPTYLAYTFYGNANLRIVSQ